MLLFLPDRIYYYHQKYHRTTNFVREIQNIDIDQLEKATPARPSL